jgi:hypothetical protein
MKEDFRPIRRSSSLCQLGAPRKAGQRATFNRVMRSTSVMTTAAFAGLGIAQVYPRDEVDLLAKASLPNIAKYLAKRPQGNCTLDNAVRRREW